MVNSESRRQEALPFVPLKKELKLTDRLMADIPRFSGFHPADSPATPPFGLDRHVEGNKTGLPQVPITGAKPLRLLYSLPDVVHLPPNGHTAVAGVESRCNLLSGIGKGRETKT